MGSSDGSRNAVIIFYGFGEIAASLLQHLSTAWQAVIVTSRHERFLKKSQAHNNQRCFTVLPKHQGELVQTLKKDANVNRLPVYLVYSPPGVRSGLGSYRKNLSIFKSDLEEIREAKRCLKVDTVITLGSVTEYSNFWPVKPYTRSKIAIRDQLLKSELVSWHLVIPPFNASTKVSRFVTAHRNAFLRYTRTQRTLAVTQAGGSDIWAAIELSIYLGAGDSPREIIVVGQETTVQDLLVDAGAQTTVEPYVASGLRMLAARLEAYVLAILAFMGIVNHRLAFFSWLTSFSSKDYIERNHLSAAKYLRMCETEVKVTPPHFFYQSTHSKQCYVFVISNTHCPFSLNLPDSASGMMRSPKEAARKAAC